MQRIWMGILSITTIQGNRSECVLNVHVSGIESRIVNTFQRT